MLEHVALVTRDIGRLRDFYVRHFGGVAEPWGDPNGRHRLCFISFEGGGTRLELENEDGIGTIDADRERIVGIAHLAFMVKSRKELHDKTQELIDAGHPLRTAPRAYGRDFYESSFFDPDGNIVELTVGKEYLDREYAEEDAE